MIYNEYPPVVMITRERALRILSNHGYCTITDIRRFNSTVFPIMDHMGDMRGIQMYKNREVLNFCGYDLKSTCKVVNGVQQPHRGKKLIN